MTLDDLDLDDLDLAASIRADLERIAQSINMSDEILADHIPEVYAPADGDDDLERLPAGVDAMIAAHARSQGEGDLGAIPE